jgi:LacI family transcriptional regulator
VRDGGCEGRLREDLTLATRPVVQQQHAARLAQDQGVDGLTCPSEVAALAVRAGLQDAGIKIGARVDVIAKQTSDTFGPYRPRVDTIHADIHAAGKAPGSLILRRIAREA